jgi:hypothetical protein
MQYEVNYQLNGEDRVMQIDAEDAADAATLVRRANERENQRYELLLVHLTNSDRETALPHMSEVAVDA